MSKKVFVEYFVGGLAPNVARKLRRRGFEAHVKDGAWLVVLSDMRGDYQSTLDQIRRAMIAVCPRAVPIDWGTLEQ